MSGVTMRYILNKELGEVLSGMKREFSQLILESEVILDRQEKEMILKAKNKLCDLLFKHEEDDYIFVLTFKF